MEQKNQGNLMNVLSFVAEQTMAFSRENTVLGEPIQKDGVTIIPISKLSVGFAGGGADLEDGGRKKSKHPAGGGAKVSRTPISFLVIDGKEVRTINLEVSEPSPIAELVDTVIATVKKNKNNRA